MNKYKFLVIAACLIQTAKAEIKLPALVGSNMVLQRDKPIKIWGYGQSGEKIIIDFAGKQTDATTGKDGKWYAQLPALKYGGPYQMTLKGSNSILLKNILIGDVWICSGQSNMEFNLQDALNAEGELKKANYPQIRLFNVEKKITITPQQDTKGNWNICTADQVKYFPAIGYFFGRKINTDVKIPIGLINASWGGTVIESWISADGLQTEPTFGLKAKQVATFDTAAYNYTHRQLNEKWVRNFNNQDQGLKNGQYLWANTGTENWKTITLPSGWEFTGLKDLWELDGIVWFQKELTLNSSQINGDIKLNLGVILNADQAFVNGKQIGSTGDSWGKIRNYTIPKELLTEGKNIITVRIENYGGDGGFMSKSSLFYLKANQDSIPLAGEWQYKVGYKSTQYDRPEKEIGPNTLPTLMFNDMISPIVKFSIKGVLWYQGESNWDRGYQYRELFPRMIGDWRRLFNQGDFPFLFVQLANFHKKMDDPGDSYWAEVREAQSMALKVANTGMATAIDVGDASNIHPKNKQEVGYRLALLAEKQVYNLPVAIASGPSIKSFEVNGNTITLQFKNTGTGLKTKNNIAPGNFQIAGADKAFYWAKAEITGKNSIKIFNERVPVPVAVRYAWEDNPADANIVNSAGLPLFPFRTDDWKGLTANAK